MLSVSHSTFSFLVSLSSGLVEMTCFLRGLGSGKPLDNRSPTQTGFQGSQMVLEEKIACTWKAVSRGMMDFVTRISQHSVKSFLAADRLIFILLIKVIKTYKVIKLQYTTALINYGIYIFLRNRFAILW